jgi:hypothetical protein
LVLPVADALANAPVVEVWDMTVGANAVSTTNAITMPIMAVIISVTPLLLI